MSSPESPRKTVRNYGVFLVVGLVVGGIGWWRLDGDAKPKATPSTNPHEYVYLDPARLDSYLGQIEKGNTHSINQIETGTTNVNVGLQLDTLASASASRTKQLTTSTVVTLTEADLFNKLLEKLEKSGLTPLSAESRIIASQLDPKAAGVGAMILIKDARLKLPPYLSVFRQLRYISYRTDPSRAFGEPSLGRSRLARYTSGHEAKIEAARAAFRKRLGVDPRLPLTIKIHSHPISDKEKGPIEKGKELMTEPAVTIVIPARFGDLTGDPSLLSDRVTILGKLVYNGSGFGDAASEDAYVAALLRAPKALLRELGVQKAALNSPEALFNGLLQSLTFKGRVVEVIPVAIYD